MSRLESIREDIEHFNDDEGLVTEFNKLKKIIQPEKLFRGY